MIVELDSLDKDILNLMKENSKLPYAEMASQLHSSVGTI
ncbi:MAG: DNA-binding Lrp family transcriptional regulator, partial [Chitinophagales bacterium]